MRVLGVIVTAGVVALSGAALAAASIGGPYGAREPASCESRKEPAQGAPSAAQVAQYLKCTVEGIGDGRLYLLENVRVTEVGAGRSYDARADYFSDMDKTAMVYPIKGSLVRYNCHHLQETGMAPNESCETFTENNATGVCYKRTNGDWACDMSDLLQTRVEGVPPPK